MDAQIVLAGRRCPSPVREEVLDNADAEYGGGFAQRVRDR